MPRLCPVPESPAALWVSKRQAGDETTLGNEGPPRTTSVGVPPTPVTVNSTGSVAELDLFGDPIPSSKQNGTKEPDTFDLGVMGEALAQPSKEARACPTPESFLGPTASSLVNLDSLVKPPQAAKTRNPFLTGRSLIP